jgi:hypothetical protein
MGLMTQVSEDRFDLQNNPAVAQSGFRIEGPSVKSTLLLFSLAASLFAIAGQSAYGVETPDVSGGWALQQASGSKLPLGSCVPTKFDSFSFSGADFVWSAPVARGAGSLRLRITSPSLTNSFKVIDSAGIIGTITIDKNKLVQEYSNGVSLTFSRCK